MSYKTSATPAETLTAQNPQPSTNPTAPQHIAKLIQQYGCGPVQFSGTDNALL